MTPKASQQRKKEALKALRASSARERLLHRLHSVMLVMHGSSASEAARIYGDSPRAVAYWVKRFQEDGVSGLQEDERPGRPPTLNESQLKKLRAFMVRSLGEKKAVNADSISAYVLKEFGVSLTRRHCWRIIKMLRT